MCSFWRTNSSTKDVCMSGSLLLDRSGSLSDLPSIQMILIKNLGSSLEYFSIPMHIFSHGIDTAGWASPIALG